MENDPDHLEVERVLIGAEGTEPTGATTRTGDAHKRDLEEELDAALACTFPASDPVGCLGTELNCSKPGD